MVRPSQLQLERWSMTKLKITTAALIAASLLAGGQTAFAAPGYKTTRLEVSHRGVPLELHIWYPTQQEGETTFIGKNPVFTGVEIRRDAKPLDGEHPLVLLSHGSGGNAVNIAWIAADLADKGMVVVATNHPGTTSRDSHPKQTVKVWERPQDLSAIADSSIKTGFGFLKIDAAKIGAVGFSLGGHSVLSAAGAQVRQRKFADYCRNFQDMWDCGWLAKGGVDFEKIEATRFEQKNLDPRIKAVVAIDPALAQAYDENSIKAVSTPVLLVNLGRGKAVPAAINASIIAPMFPRAEHVHVPDSVHFSFLGECTAIGEKIIEGEGEDAICSDTGKRERADIHRELKDKIGKFLEQHLMQH